MHRDDSPENRERILNSLARMARLDTLFRDRYLTRARQLLQLDLPPDTYAGLAKKKTALANLPNQIRNAMSDGNWGRVRELGLEHERYKTELAHYAPLQDIAGQVYEAGEIPIDPFSPGMNVIPGVARQSLESLRGEARRSLADLGYEDSDYQTFYHRRLDAFNHLMVSDLPSAGQFRGSPREMETEAFQALEEGNYSKLVSLAAGLSSAPSPESLGISDGNPHAAPTDLSDIHFEFDRKTIDRAAELGLKLLRVPSHYREFEPLCRFAWHPNYIQMQENHGGVLKVPDLPFPDGMPDALKGRVQLFATHPMINSGGVRFLPPLVSEDVLVETFPEPTSDKEMPRTGLLEALGLANRNRLTRHAIENLLQGRGGEILEHDLGLDPNDFRLVCIPPDLHLRLGLERGWGQEKIWTHFDGYLVLMDGTLRPLAGGDVRYGGIYDLLGLSSNYDSERVIVRFAVVQRRRMALWQIA